MLQTSGLTVRQHEREGIEVPIEFVVCNNHRAQVHYGPGSAAVDQFTVKGKAIDISAGGMGLESRHFIPRMCEGTIRVYAPNEVTLAADGSSLLELAFEHPVKVRRVYTIGREPTYALGVAFIEHQPDLDARVNALLERIKAAKPAPAATGGKHA